MNHAYILDGRVSAVVPDEDPIFPGIPVEKRFSAEFLSHCVDASPDTDVKPGYVYTDGNFTLPPIDPALLLPTDPQTPGE